MESLVKYTDTYKTEWAENYKTMNANDFVNRLNDMQPSYEVLFAGNKYKLYFDVDLKIDSDFYNDDICNIVKERCLYYIETCLIELTSVKPNIAITESHSSNYKDNYGKISFHFYISNMTGTLEEIKQVSIGLNNFVNSKPDGSENIWEYIDDELNENELFDKSVYKSSQTFRCVNTNKPNEKRPMILIQGSVEQTIIQGFLDENSVEIKIPQVLPSKKTECNDTTSNTSTEFLELQNYIDNGLFLKLDYEKWINVGLVLKYIFENDGLFLWDKISQLYPKNYDKEGCKTKYELLKPNGNIKLGTIHYYLKTENEKLYTSLKRDFYSSQIDLINNDFTTGLLADYFKTLYSNQFIYTDKKLYYWNGYYWKPDDDELCYLTNFIDKQFVKDIKHYTNIKLSQTEDDDKRKRIAVFLSKSSKIRNSGFRKSLIEDITKFISNNEQKFNLNDYLFVFENAVFDLRIGKVIEPSPEDFMTISCGYNYEELDKVSMNDLDDIINSIFPNKQVKEHYLEALSTGLCGLQLEKCFVATGRGGNGKSLLNGLMLETCGKYGYKLPTNVLIKPIKEGANPEVANMDCKRFCLTSEPDKKQKIVSSTLKDITGEKTFNVRSLYSNKCNITLKQSLILEANELPVLDEVNDALYRRMDVTPFVCSAVSQEDYDNANEEMRKYMIIANPYYKTEDFRLKMKIVLFHYLQPYFKEFFERGCVLKAQPLPVKEATKKYLACSDTFYDWFIETYEECEGEYVYYDSIYEKWNEDIRITTDMSRRKGNKITSKRKILEEIENNIFLRKYLKDRKVYYNNIQLTKPAITGWKLRPEDENIDEPECI
jgi:phage/plasmid-associated DNA primase